ncbi:MAG: 30S ribosomal protein S12 methylthiotransferase RimO [Candidatus Aminicenantes bacterium]|nr:30S ribosomal protein S12 methylthiotransferase RimO [Candidatus Aminicenantes bacterium]
MNHPSTTVSFVSLGCFKNTVDTEVLGGMLEQMGVRIVSSYEEADWIIINTCGFIQPAKEESISEILSALEMKAEGKVRHVAVIGCLSERYLDELTKNFPEVDLIWGVNDPRDLAAAIAFNQPARYGPTSTFLYNHNHSRILTTPPNTGFIKISEGCDMKCSFCAIPAIRGPYRSRDTQSVIREAETMRKRGVAELNLISQNSTYFGLDRGPASLLPQMLRSLSTLGFDWIRVLYLMPEAVTEEILEGFSHPGILPYFDLPLQHVSTPLLRRMRRGGSADTFQRLIETIRRDFSDAIIRSTFITGFPGETEALFQELCDFARELRIERIGAFAFSPEEGTPAFDLDDPVPVKVAMHRREELMDISDANLEAYNRRIIGTVQSFLPGGPSPWEQQTTLGRISSQAPEVDGLTEIRADFSMTSPPVPARITSFRQNILQGETA